MISDTDADVGKHNVWTRILLSPRDEVYSNAAWNATSRESLRSSIRYNASYIDSNVQQGATDLIYITQINRILRKIFHILPSIDTCIPNPASGFTLGRDSRSVERTKKFP